MDANNGGSLLSGQRRCIIWSCESKRQFGIPYCIDFEDM